MTKKLLFLRLHAYLLRVEYYLPHIMIWSSSKMTALRIGTMMVVMKMNWSKSHTPLSLAPCHSPHHITIITPFYVWFSTGVPAHSLVFMIIITLLLRSNYIIITIIYPSAFCYNHYYNDHSQLVAICCSKTFVFATPPVAVLKQVISVDDKNGFIIDLILFTTHHISI